MNPKDKQAGRSDRSPDIYSTQRTDRERGAFMPAAGYPAPDAWTKELRRGRRSSILFGLTVFGFTILLCVIIFQQYLISIRPRQARSGTPGEMVTVRTSASPLDLNVPLEATMVMEELTATTLLPIPEDGELPFDAQWIKQAAYYVALGEKAYKEERLEVALGHFDKALKIFPRLRGVRRYMGLIALQLKDYPLAAEHFKEAAAEDASSYGVANNLGVAHLALKDYDTAEDYFRQALQLNPDYALAYLNLATLHMRAGNKEQAAEHFSKYLEFEPNDTRAAENYASVLMDLERWQQAITLLEQVRQSAPDVAPVYFRLAQALSHTAERDAAIQVLQRGATLVDPRKALAWLSQPQFDLLRDNPDFQALTATLGATKD
ncbi:MAG: tetratricopeptide repeat protein [Kiritimatiellae bacterium]|nr:tetratricopeptide repeat protein [Kiritimatiellia bacterium]